MKKKFKPQFGKLSIILLVVIAVLIAADLLTKHFEELYPALFTVSIIPGVVELRSGIRNPGCAFSFLDDNPQIGQPILITVTFILMIVMIFGFIFIPNRLVLLKVAISMIIAGAIGNLVDRIAFFYVRDWFGLWMFGKIAYCNLADFWIVIGTALAAVDLLFINEFSIFPLTKKAKVIQAAKREEEERKKEEEAEGKFKPDISNGLNKDIIDDTDAANKSNDAGNGLNNNSDGAIGGGESIDKSANKYGEENE